MWVLKSAGLPKHSLVCVCVCGGGGDKNKSSYDGKAGRIFGYSTQLSISVLDVYAEHIRGAKYLAVNDTAFFSNLFLTCFHAICSYTSEVYKTWHFDMCQHSDVLLKGKSTRCLDRRLRRQ